MACVLPVSYTHLDVYKRQDLNLLTEEKVPDDCEILFINGPQSDLSKEDAKKIQTYLKGDGKVYFVANATAEELPNFKSILKTYGITMEKGVVIEGDSNHYMQMPTYLIPNMGSSDVTKAIENQYVLVPISKGFTHGEDVYKRQLQRDLCGTF